MIRVDTVTELVDAGPAARPPAAARRARGSAILGNSESLGLLTYDACLTAGLRPLPPLDLTTAARRRTSPPRWRAALADAGCDAVRGHRDPAGRRSAPTADAALAAGPASGGRRGPAQAGPRRARGDAARALAATPSPAARDGTRTAEPGDDPAPPTRAAPGRRGAAKPVVVVQPRRRTRGRPARRGRGRPAPVIPAYPAADRAVRALAEAVEYAAWRRRGRRARPGARVRRHRGGGGRRRHRPAAARRARPSGAVTLATRTRRALLGRYGIAVRPAAARPRRRGRAVAAAAPLGYPVALKTTAPHLRHRADLGGVRLDLADEEQLRRAYARADRPARRARGAAARRPGDGAARGGHRRARRRWTRPRAPCCPSGWPGAPSELLGDVGAPAGPGHRPGRRGAGPLDQGRAAAVRLARLRAGRHRRPGGAAAAGVAAGRRPPRGRRGRPGAGGGRRRAG